VATAAVQVATAAVQLHTTTTTLEMAEEDSNFEGDTDTDLWVKDWSKARVCRPIETLPLDAPIRSDMVRFVCISDTHEQLGDIVHRIPNGDVLLHCGDFTDTGGRQAVINFNEQMGSLPHRYKIVISGNHECGFDPTSTDLFAYRGTPEGYKLLTNVTYLQDSSTKVYGLNIYGSPWHSLEGWAYFRRRGDHILKEWLKIPVARKDARLPSASSAAAALADQTTTATSSASAAVAVAADGDRWVPEVDVLMTHTPPLGHSDWEHVWWSEPPGALKHFGCKDLLDVVEKRVRPRVHVFGHIHERNGATTNGETVFINASICDNEVQVLSEPRIFDLPLPDGVSKI